uniref:Acid phosphatase n=1 Tax=Eutreptiella gymnastica TaxID=73025 RepID=A0A6T2IAT7_9EUGL
MVAIVAKFGSPKKSREGPLALAMVTTSGAKAKTAGKSDTSAQEKTSFAFNADAASFPPITGAGQLRQCIVLLRHGDRAPMTRDMGALVSGEDNEELWRERLPSPQTLAHMDSRFPIKQHKSQLVAWDEGEQPFCQLTAQGVAEITAIGSALRQRLVKGCAPAQSSILNAVADPQEVHVVSTNTTRTHQTSQAFLQGLYPDAASGSIPVQVRSQDEETLLPSPGDAYLSMKADRIRNAPPLSPPVRQCLNAFGLDYEADYTSLCRIRDILTCHAVHELRLPEGVTASTVEEITKEEARQHGHRYEDEVYTLYNIGRFCNELLQTMQSAVNSSSPGGAKCPKLALYTTHDTTIIPFLCALGVFDGTWPKYGSNVLLELAQDVRTNEHFVRLLYDGAPRPFPFATPTSPLGHEWCAWSVFEQNLATWSLDPVAYNKMCSVQNRSLQTNGSMSEKADVQVMEIREMSDIEDIAYEWKRSVRRARVQAWRAKKQVLKNIAVVNATILAFTAFSIAYELLHVDVERIIRIFESPVPTLTSAILAFDLLARLPSDLIHHYESLVPSNPVFYKACTSGVAYTIGDFISQVYQGRNLKTLDLPRCIRSGTAGFIGHGPLCHYWIGFMETYLDFGGAWWGTGFKVIADQTVWSLYLNAVYSFLIGALAFRNPADVWQDVKTTSWPALRSSWRFWPFVHTISFSHSVPIDLKLLWVDTMEIVWVTILSRVANQDDKKEPENAYELERDGDFGVDPSLEIALSAQAEELARADAIPRDHPGLINLADLKVQVPPISQVFQVAWPLLAMWPLLYISYQIEQFLGVGAA